jgi:heme/copper-type cytochrome/quinol oxidase subunit 3
MAAATATPTGAAAAAGAPRRAPQAALVATVLVISSGVMFVAALVGVFMSLRHATPDPGQNWVPSRIDIPNAPLVLAGLTALMASVTAQWAAWASRRSERGHTYAAIGITVLLAAAFLNLVFDAMNKAEMVLGSSGWANLAFTLTGASVALTTAAIGYLLLSGLRTLGGDLGPDHTADLEGAVMFWHFTVVAWAAVWYVVYVVK